LSLGYQTKNLEIDASSDTLLLENDSDLLYTRAINEKYKNADILVLAFSPKEELLSEESLKAIQSLSSSLVKLEKINNIISILNVPLLQSPIRPVSELVNDIPTLESPNIDKELVKKEFLNSPIYKNNLVSSDFQTTALVLELKDDTKYLELKNKLKTLAKNSIEYKETFATLKAHRDIQRELNHQFIKDVREIIEEHKYAGKLFLGGVNMIADDMISFIKNDLRIYGTALLTLLVIVLWVIFREIRWIVIPVIISLFSILSTTGLLGLFGWEVTVISSNFISLQLIITISIILHLIVRYRELALTCKDYTQEELVLETILSKASPSFFAIITTIVGFGSLALSNILPIMNLGWMMSSGIMLSLIIAFLLFPAFLLLVEKSTPHTAFEKSFSLTKIFANIVAFHGKKILIVSILICIFSISGASKLMVENSFINYFKSNTQIYKGMEIIDEKLGGTTPLDVIVNFKTTEIKVEQPVKPIDDFDDFANEFESTDDEAQYWFTDAKMKKVEEIHDYLASLDEIGSVQSLATILKIGRTLNKGKDLDNFKLALLYNKIPPKFKKVVLDAYLSIKDDQVRFTTRIVDSNPNLRRDELIKKINTDIKNILEDKGTYRLSNLMILYNNMLQSLFKSQILTLGFVLISLFAMFLLIFRSIKIATIAIVANIVPMSLIFGFMGWFGIPLDLMTITIAAISLGIGVDDTIHYIHRYLEEIKKDGDFLQAMYRSHNSIGFAMYYTTFAIILGFSILVFSNFIPTIYFGLLTVLVMFMALLGALLLLPKLFIMYKIK
jgi:predicted RND superfamily exporter protein